jgi:CHASE2 domain-containing sensor protein
MRETEEPSASSPRFLRGFSLGDLRAERRRAVVSFAVGLVVLLLIQLPVVEQSFLGAPDRQMMETAFRLRADVTAGRADPVLFLDIDDRTLSRLAPPSSGFAPPLATTPRAAIADLLDFIRTGPVASTPGVVIVDVDIAQPASDGSEGIARLKSALAAWAATKGAPPLIISRQPYQTAALGLADRPGFALPDTPYDAIVQPAPNIYWAETEVLGDLNGVIREFLPYQCVITSRDPGGHQPLYSAALLAYMFTERDAKVLGQAHARHWMSQAAAHCQTQPAVALKHGERIDFHLSLDLGFMGRVWPDLDPRWPGFRRCGDTDAAIFRRLSVIDVLDAAHADSQASRGLFCQHLVIIGGTNESSADFVQTPYSEMNGSVVLANAIRGLQLTHGGLRPIPLIFQILGLLVVSLSISACALITERARHRYRQLRHGPHKHSLVHRLAIIPLNPLIVNGIIALTAHCMGIVLLMISLNFGLWGFLSAPAFAAAITETVQEFADG